MNTIDCDVVVIGGGPAGLSTAIWLATYGLRVMVCESKVYPHDKMCGEFLSPECAGILRELGVYQRIINCHPIEITHAKVSAPDGSSWSTDLPGQAIGLSRRLFDSTLADRAREAGVALFEKTTVNAITGDLDRGFQVEARSGPQALLIKSRVAIGAYGKRAALDTALGRKFILRRQPYLALKAHFYQPAMRSDEINLHTFPGGYCGYSAIEDGASVACMLVHERSFKQAQPQPGRSPDRFIAWMRMQNQALDDWFQKAERIMPRWISTAQVCFDPKPAVEKDVIMVGDTAGLIAPLAGNGIAMALEGGQIAAQLIRLLMQKQITTEELRQLYPQSWRKAFNLRISIGRMVQPLMFNPTATSLALRLINMIPQAGSYLVNSTRGKGSIIY